MWQDAPRRRIVVYALAIGICAAVVARGAPGDKDKKSEPLLSKLGFGNKRNRPADPETLAKARVPFEKADEQFQAASKLEGDARRKAFWSASEQYKKVAAAVGESDLQEDALMWTGEAAFFADRYPNAVRAYDELIKQYSNTRYMDRVMARRFSIATYWLAQEREDPSWPLTPNVTTRERPRFDTFGNGIKVLDSIRFQDPTGKLADDATILAANANFERGKYLRADELYEDLRNSFPNSEHQFKAHFLGLKCKLMVYEGPEYDGNVLDEAAQLVQQIYRVFPQEAATEKEYLQATEREIRLKKAEYEWRLASYFDRRKEYGGARMYYDTVRREYADTNLGQEADKRMGEISEEPDAPKQQAEWLTKLFPRPKPARPLLTRMPTMPLKR